MRTAECSDMKHMFVRPWIYILFAIAVATSSAKPAEGRALFENCVNRFTLIFQEIQRKRLAKLATGVEPPEIGEISNYTQIAEKVRLHLGGNFWLLPESEQRLAIKELAKDGRITPPELNEVENILKLFANDSKPEERRELLRNISNSQDPRTVGTILRILAGGSKSDGQIRYLVNSHRLEVSRSCAVVTPACEAQALATVVGSNRRAVTTADLKSRLKSDGTANFQISTGGRFEESESKEVYNFLRDANSIFYSPTDGWSITGADIREMPPSLSRYLDNLLAVINALDSKATITNIEIIAPGKGGLRTPLNHQDRANGVLILSALFGRQPWIQGADGAFFQMERAGDLAVLLGKFTGNGTPHFSAIDRNQDRLVLRIALRSRRFDLMGAKLKD